MRDPTSPPAAFRLVPSRPLSALLAERSWWKRLARLAWCAFLLLAGRLSIVDPAAAPRKWAQPVFAPYVAPVCSAHDSPSLQPRAPPIPS
jgi:hypothetical protein